MALRNQDILNREEAGLLWYARYDFARVGRFILYAKATSGAYDGDDAGHEWPVGFAIHFESEKVYSLFNDDGRGNGTFIASYDTFRGAAERAEMENAKYPQ